jgi:uncharacterized membrane protein YebE (DUF533 family)
MVNYEFFVIILAKRKQSCGRLPMPVSGESGGKLAAMIKKAIDDGHLTNSEYERILALADSDGVIDAQEKRMLAQLQEMLSNKMVKRVPD